ncbi:MAG TPA: hypothetical protein VKM55_22085, partial [Candidatus Lokiarchaeia archaeon]|nr:hypothetical protein [Candidatus Lokiarchaeia archaeon]
GISLFNHTWQAGSRLIEADLYSGMVQGIMLIMEESVGQGDVKEVTMESGRLIISKAINLPIICVLATTKSSKTLRVALDRFKDRFIAEFRDNLRDTNLSSQFDGTSKLVEECFPFLPIYD